MIDLSVLANIHADIEVVHQLVETLKARVDGKDIGIHIYRNRNGHFFYELSHMYRGADSMDPAISIGNSYDSVEEAAKGALQSAVMFYRSTDEGGAWVRNESFFH
ncbi:hypothetical protein [Paenibacillus silviterrae]|uniref:hypothetical protein n=1 Tax=Paenibacillus silviterrae TaxID=3242194 RepID=UPI0025433B9E|nr:hypothetical protein [Paenibacillus chinjuensis]